MVLITSYNELVTGAFVNQRSHHVAGGLTNWHTVHFSGIDDDLPLKNLGGSFQHFLDLSGKHTKFAIETIESSRKFGTDFPSYKKKRWIFPVRF